jgi:putative phosphoserine phosphatase/1-acylglycerol-3-phosphate O-acyltransferase
VDDWTLDELPERIAEVRQIFLDTLKSWPDDELPSFPIYERPRTRKPKIRSVPNKTGAAGTNSGTGRVVKGRP